MLGMLLCRQIQQVITARSAVKLPGRALVVVAQSGGADERVLFYAMRRCPHVFGLAGSQHSTELSQFLIAPWQGDGGIFSSRRK